MTVQSVLTAAGTDGPPAVEVEGLVKRLAGRTVVDGLSFTVWRGEVFALLGPNGAGKTTTVETLEGFHAPDGGAVRVLGLDPRRAGPPFRARIGVMLQEGGIAPALRPAEALRYLGRLYREPRVAEELIELVGLTEARRTPYRRLSGGEKQRFSLAAALVGRPELLFLDEPTAGMDPQARRQTWQLIRDQQRAGVTILLTTHFLDEADRLADRVAIIDDGRLRALDSPAALRAGAATGTRSIRLRARVPLEPAAAGGLTSVRGARAADDGGLIVESDRPADALVELAGWARSAGVELTALTVGEASLEDVFLRLVGAGVDGADDAEGRP